MTTCRQAALRYAARGWAVFPCCVGSKFPATKHGFKDATTNPDQIARWWTENANYNVAIRTGDGLYAVDVDDPAWPLRQALPPTLVSQTPRGGFHYLFATTERLPNTTSSIGDKIDSRGDGGYIVAAPSQVAGKLYRWEDEMAELAPLPEWVARLVRPAARHDPTPPTTSIVPYRASGSASAYGDRALRDEYEKVSRNPEGGRNNQLNVSTFRIAQLVAGGQLDEQHARGMMIQAGMASGLGERESSRTVESAWVKGMETPRAPAPRADPAPGVEFYVEADVEPLPDDPPSATKVKRAVQPPDDRRQHQLIERVADLGGMLGPYCQWVVGGADYPQPNLTVASLLALGAVLAGRRFVYGRATSSLYVAAVARTGEGKGRPQSCLERLLRCCWDACCGPSDLSSTVSTIERISTATHAGGGILFPLDEYGAKLRTLLDQRSGHQRDMRALLLQMATIGTGDYVAATSMARGGQDRMIQVPSVTIFGSTTPHTLHDALGRAALDDGFLGRHLFFQGLEVLPARARELHAGHRDPIPTELEGAVGDCRHLAEEWHKNQLRKGTLPDGQPAYYYQPVQVKDAGGWDVLAAFGQRIDSTRRSPTDDVPTQMLARAAEHASRICLGLAVLTQPQAPQPQVTAQHAQLAVQLVDESIASIGRSLALYAADSDHERSIKRVLEDLRQLGGPDGWVRRRDVLRRCRSVTTRDLDDILARLAADGTLEVRKTKPTAGGREQVAVRLADAAGSDP